LKVEYGVLTESLPCNPVEENCSQARLRNALFYEGEARQAHREVSFRSRTSSDTQESETLETELQMSSETVQIEKKEFPVLNESKLGEIKATQIDVLSVPALETSKLRKAEKKAEKKVDIESAALQEQNLPAQNISETSKAKNLKKESVSTTSAKAKLRKTGIDVDPSEDTPLFANLKLKKTEVVKRKIETPVMETVQLIHHEFENVPLEPDLEQLSNALIISEPFPEIGNNMENMDSEKSYKKKSPLKSKNISGNVMESFPLEAQHKQNEESSISSPKQSSKYTVKKGQTKKAQAEPEVSEFSNVTLKKSEIIKRPFSPLQVESVQLAHHEFENVPQDPYLEADSGVCIRSDPKNEGKLDLESTPIKKKQPEKKIKKHLSPIQVKELPKTTTDDKKTSKSDLTSDSEKKTLKETALEQLRKPLQVLAAQECYHDMESEEVTRKPKDPVTQHAAAIEKKHSDIERISLPTFLNFPSEQGVTVIAQDGIIEKSMQPNFEKICETIQGDSSPTPNIVETQPVIQASGKKRILLKDQSNGSQAIPVSKPMVTTETVTFMEVFHLAHVFLYQQKVLKLVVIFLDSIISFSSSACH
jgi:hypothetical protein